MRLYTFQIGELCRIGVELDHQLVALGAAYDAMTAARGQKPGAPRTLQSDMLTFLSMGEPALTAAGNVVAFMKKRPALPVGERATYLFEEVKLLAPIPRPGKILCSGLNYKSHVEENPNAKFLEDPRFFSKLPNTVIGPGASIRHPGERFCVDYEVELAVVIGRTMPQGMPAARVMEHIAG